jgi:hypothetical protein
MHFDEWAFWKGACRLSCRSVAPRAWCSRFGGGFRHYADLLRDRPDGATLPSQSLQDALCHAVELENEAYRLATDAMIEEKEGKIQIRLAIHARSQENRIKIETMIREELAARETLIPFDRATEIFRRGLTSFSVALNGSHKKKPRPAILRTHSMPSES